MITKFTRVVPIDKKEIDFSFSEELTTTATGKPLNISAFQELKFSQPDMANLKSKTSF